MTDAAKALRAMLCIESECTFDAGCGCLDAIRAALAAAQAGTPTYEELHSRSPEAYKQGFAAGAKEIERLQAEIERMLKALSEAGDEILRQRRAGAEWQEKYKKLATAQAGARTFDSFSISTEKAASLIRDAEAKGFAAGIEAARKCCEGRANSWIANDKPMWSPGEEASACALAISDLLPAAQAGANLKYTGDKTDVTALIKYAQELEAALAAAQAGDRCEVTGNPVGTDTWMVGHPCQCAACQAYIRALRPAETGKDYFDQEWRWAKNQAAAQAGAGVSLSSNEGLENWQQGFAAGIEAAANFCSFKAEENDDPIGKKYAIGIRALRPAETAKDYFDQEWRWAKNQAAKEVVHHTNRNRSDHRNETPPLSASEPAGASDDAVTYDPMGAVMTSEYPEPQAAEPSEEDLARMAEAIQKSIERGCDITPPESMIAARAAYMALLRREVK